MSVFVDAFLDRLISRGLSDDQVAQAMVKAALLEPGLRREFGEAFTAHGLPVPSAAAYNQAGLSEKQGANRGRISGMARYADKDDDRRSQGAAADLPDSVRRSGRVYSRPAQEGQQARRPGQQTKVAAAVGEAAARAAGNAAAHAAGNAAGHATGNAAAHAAGNTAGHATGNAAARAPGNNAGHGPGSTAPPRSGEPGHTNPGQFDAMRQPSPPPPPPPTPPAPGMLRRAWGAVNTVAGHPLSWILGPTIVGEAYNKTKGLFSTDAARARAVEAKADEAVDKQNVATVQRDRVNDMYSRMATERASPDDILKPYDNEKDPFYGAGPFLRSAMRPIGAQSGDELPRDLFFNRMMEGFGEFERARKLPESAQANMLANFDRRMQNRNTNIDKTVDVARTAGAMAGSVMPSASISALAGIGPMVAPMATARPEGGTFAQRAPTEMERQLNEELKPEGGTNPQVNPGAQPGAAQPGAAQPGAQPGAQPQASPGTQPGAAQPPAGQQQKPPAAQDPSAVAVARVKALADQYSSDPGKLMTLTDPKAAAQYQEQIAASVKQVEQALKEGRISPELARFQKGQLLNASLIASQAAAAKVTGSVPKIETLREQLNAAQPGTPLYQTFVDKLVASNPDLVAELNKAHPDLGTGPMDRIEQIWNALGDEKIAGGWGRTLVLGGLSLGLLGILSGVFGGAGLASLAPILGGLGMAGAPFLMGGAIDNPALANALGGLVGQAPSYVGHTLTDPGAPETYNPVATQMLEMLNSGDKAGAMAMLQKAIAADPQLKKDLRGLIMKVPIVGTEMLNPAATPERIYERSKRQLSPAMGQAIISNWNDIYPMLKEGFLLSGRVKQAKPFDEASFSDVGTKRPMPTAQPTPRSKPLIDPQRVVDAIDSVIPRGNGYDKATDRMGIRDAGPQPDMDTDLWENLGRAGKHVWHNYSSAPKLLYNLQGNVGDALYKATENWDKDNPWDPVGSDYRTLAEAAERNGRPDLATAARYGAVIGPNALMSPTNVVRNGPMMLPYAIPGLSNVVTLGDAANEYEKGNYGTAAAYGLAGLVPVGGPLVKGMLAPTLKTTAKSTNAVTRAASRAATSTGKALNAASHVAPIAGPLGRDITDARRRMHAANPYGAPAAEDNRVTLADEAGAARPQPDVAIGKTSAPGDTAKPVQLPTPTPVPAAPVHKHGDPLPLAEHGRRFITGWQRLGERPIGPVKPPPLPPTSVPLR